MGSWERELTAAAAISYGMEPMVTEHRWMSEIKSMNSYNIKKSHNL